MYADKKQVCEESQYVLSRQIPGRAAEDWTKHFFLEDRERWLSWLNNSGDLTLLNQLRADLAAYAG